DFRNTVIIMTSNVGAQLIRRDSVLGFVKEDEAKDAAAQYNRMKDKVLGEMKNVFRPEFLNRIDQTVVFHALSRENLRQIVGIQLRDVERQLASKGIQIEITEAAKDWLGDKGYDPVFGARPLRRLIQNEIEDKLSEALLQEQFASGDK